MRTRSRTTLHSRIDYLRGTRSDQKDVGWELATHFTPPPHYADGNSKIITALDS